MAKKRRDEESFEDGGELISTGRKKKRREKAARAEKNEARSVRDPRGGKVRIDLDEQERAYNKYYLAVANRYRYARYAAFIVLVAFLLTILIFYRGSITYSNLMYLIRDLDSDTEVSVGVYSDVTYDEVHSPQFAMFRSRIAPLREAAIFRTTPAFSRRSLRRARNTRLCMTPAVRDIACILPFRAFSAERRMKISRTAASLTTAALHL